MALLLNIIIINKHQKGNFINELFIFSFFFTPTEFIAVKQWISSVKTSFVISDKSHEIAQSIIFNVEPRVL